MEQTQEAALPSPFPRALSFFEFGDGAVLGMMAGSLSALNLVDIVNAHRLTGGSPVPELIALYYTARMLAHLENLHLHGKYCTVMSNQTTGFLPIQKQLVELKIMIVAMTLI
jgi:hypothetical protein|mmetsp:Transcript_22556/g.32728  ORF Transcript_22556/g.32728 Transcript_22556/m.32728 type:complete len:112 (-) Transcript_22556:3501-3836(-)